MDIENKVVVITGAASGIGRALAQRFHRERPAQLVLADISTESLSDLATELGATAVACDVGSEADIRKLMQTTEDTWGHIDLFCGNAGILRMGGVETDNDTFAQVWDVNVMAHIYAARAALPRMLERGQGYFLITASAAGLLTQLGSLSYSISKHAALSCAEWLQVTHGHQGIKVSALCPQAVETAMTAGTDGSVAGVDGMLSAQQVAEAALEAISEERFLVLPHPQVKKYFQNKANDYGRWIGGMQRLQEQFSELMPKTGD
ncbi:SDR family oxidoreductase [Exilibacterium tricleocarpae]|uniref:SDR family oxidoreductase n=1 Tax=Exilibacterium tricleocarpae TaxID=2591008 RepID=A0A545TNV9_9GAMM|nr:SDR family oxidoreductase [Exilibacterium tricleocarpae]TQV78910.1 SDR family oxidoreductase [Exilibacterium tricleocarpae]